MKKFLLLFMGLFFITAHVVAQDFPKHVIGARVGLATSWVTSYGVSTSAKNAYMVGISNQILLSRSLPFYFDTGLTFISKGYKIKGYNDSSTTFNYLQLPLGINYHIYTNKAIILVPSVGVYYTYGLGGSRKLNGEKVSVFKDGSTSRHDFGVTCGIGASINRFHIGVAYEIGVLDIDKEDKVYSNNSNKLGYKSLKNRSITFNIGINF